VDVRVVELTVPLPTLGQLKQRHQPPGHGAPGKGTRGSSSSSQAAPTQSGAVLKALAARNAHGVPLAELARMLERWEDDPAAFKIPAAGFL
jgi:hypothetical protein